MKPLRLLLLATIANLSIFGSNVSWSKPSLILDLRGAAVQTLYNLVISRTPIGISPSGNHSLKYFSPYLSKRLINQIGTTRLCEKDWRARHPDHSIKAPFAWSEFGAFSGADDFSEVSAFVIERQESQKDGSTYVYVRLQSRPQPYVSGLPKEPAEKPFYWDVAVRVVMENENPVVDDIVYLKGQWVDSETSLSEVLMKGCQGPHWFGYPARR